LDFTQAFDRVSHKYLFDILPYFGIPAWFIDRIRTLYTEIEASVQVNGELVGTVPILSGVRQGCPLSLILFAMCLHPLPHTLQEHLPHVKVGRNSYISPVMAYADDVVIFVTRPEDLAVINTKITTYEKASGALMNPAKSCALPIAGWSTPLSPLGVSITDRTKILRLPFTTTIKQSVLMSWERTINAIRAQAQTTYSRQMNLILRMHYVTHFLLTKLWYTAQIFPATKTQTQRIISACMCFLWQGATFRVPLTTLQLPKMQGG
jgi:hypothetical protein